MNLHLNNGTCLISSHLTSDFVRVLQRLSYRVSGLSRKEIKNQVSSSKTCSFRGGFTVCRTPVQESKNYLKFRLSQKIITVLLFDACFWRTSTSSDFHTFYHILLQNLVDTFMLDNIVALQDSFVVNSNLCEPPWILSDKKVHQERNINKLKERNLDIVLNTQADKISSEGNWTNRY